MAFRKGDRLTARQLTEIAGNARTGANYTGENTIVDKDGVHVRKISQATPAPVRILMAVVVSYNVATGVAQCRTAGGKMSAAVPIDPLEPLFDVWVGYESFIRGVISNGGLYDTLWCVENPLYSGLGIAGCIDEIRYVGFTMMPGFAFEPPTLNISPLQDNPAFLSETSL